VLRVFQIHVACNGMFRVFGVKRIGVFFLQGRSSVVLGIVFI
jgi:hypothetical protein